MYLFIIYGWEIGILSFFLNNRLSALFPCDFIMKYDDDQCPADITLQEKLVNNSKNKNVIIGKKGF